MGIAYEQPIQDLLGTHELPLADPAPASGQRCEEACAPWCPMPASAAHALAILAVAADAIMGVDREGRIVSVNPAVTSVFGVQPQDVTGHALHELVPSLDGPAIEEAIRNGIWLHVSQSFVARQQTEGVRLGGVVFPIEVSIGQVPGDGPMKYAVIVRDMTEAKLAEESFNLFSRALDASHNAVLICDASRQPQPIVFVNPAFTRVTGYGPMDVLGRSPAFLIGSDVRQPDLAVLQQALATGQEASVRLRCYTRDERLFHGDLSVSPVRDAGGRITHFVGIMSDVTARVQAEQAVAERGARLDAIFELSPDGFALFDRAGRLAFVNPAFVQLTGRRWRAGPDGLDLYGFDLRLRALCDESHPYTPVATLASRARIGAPDGHTGEGERLHLIAPMHRVVDREVRTNAHGETIVYLRDITRETEVDRMKSEFLSTAAHELRTPLASIFGFTELLLHRDYPPPRQKDMLNTMHRQASLLVKLLNELLDLARIEARQGKDFHIGEHDLAGIVERSVEGLMREDTDSTVLRDLEPGLVVMADPDKLEQALGNLLSNAFKYSPPGAQVEICSRSACVRGRNYAVIEVVDRGIGMTPEQLSRAFERFYRADPSGNVPGTGLGLSLVREIADLHRGRAELQSEPGHGTIARLWIPTAADKLSRFAAF